MTSSALATDLDAAFERHRRELTGYCYRMLGSLHDAEDAVQETFFRAWRGIDRFGGRASLRTWLFRIATNVCLSQLNGRKRRALPMDLGSAGDPRALPSESLPEGTWIQPVPDHLVVGSSDDPAELTMSRESVRLAFIAALQHLAPRQRAVLILRDVLRWRSSEVAGLLATTTTAVDSLLRRARSALAACDVTATASQPTSREEQVLLARYVDAFERFDIEALVALLREDVILAMPPAALWLRGRKDVLTWLREGPGAECRNVRLRPLAANGSPAFAAYHVREDGRLEPIAIQVLDIRHDGIAAIHAYLDLSLFPLFGRDDETLSSTS